MKNVRSWNFWKHRQTGKKGQEKTNQQILKKKVPGQLVRIRLTCSLTSAKFFLSLFSCLLFFSQISAQAPAQEFAVIEGHFHDGLGTFAELVLANSLIAQNQLPQKPFDLKKSRDKMTAAIASLPETHSSRNIFLTEIANIEKAAPLGADEIIKNAHGKLVAVRHTSLEFSEAKAGDIKLEFSDRAPLPISVKTDKSHKVAVAEGQTPDIANKWAARYFRIGETELNQILTDTGFASMSEAKSHYLNISNLVARILINKLGLKNCELTDFSQAEVGNLEAAKYLLKQLRHFKHGNDDSRVIIFDRSTATVKWDSILEGINLETLTADRISFLPSRPRKGNAIASEFGIKIDGRAVVSFQIKHKRGKARGTDRQYEFSDITTRLRI